MNGLINISYLFGEVDAFSGDYLSQRSVVLFQDEFSILVNTNRFSVYGTCSFMDFHVFADGVRHFTPAGEYFSEVTFLELVVQDFEIFQEFLYQFCPLNFLFEFSFK